MLHSPVPLTIEFEHQVVRVRQLYPPSLLFLTCSPSIKDRIIALRMSHQRHQHDAPPHGGICVLPCGGFHWKRPLRSDDYPTKKTGMMRRLRVYKQVLQPPTWCAPNKTRLAFTSCRRR